SIGKVVNISKIVIKSHFIGCAMSFRKSHLIGCVPYDSGLIFSHDHWIAINAFWAGKVICVNTPLIHYRQHDSNLTPKKGLSLSGKLKVRLKLIYLVFKSFHRNKNV
ncbi:hypothetical protein, partial [Shewanella morhuae]|uniref:hypothetical protein n=1 Tax=Shewanella morhuae TaxID=365591 RepID=UPI001C7CCF41